jgi:hypothetical protein
MMFLRLEKKPFVKGTRGFFCVQKSRYLQCAQAPSSPLTGILAQAFAEPSFQSRPVGVGQIEGVIT